ncbi:MAG: aminotransferase class V-fold PLP-dependent enzyme, partial [Gammaproteobacteria bacterium]|nr:aminotransferase class V-fold PLP-dependent enzyme [Gammaproteobacteria bacterium]
NLLKPRGIVFHVDAVQAAGKIPLDVRSLPVDLMAFSAHKAYGPKGIGALFVRHEPAPRIRLEPQMHGGGHEFGMRSGTLPVHQIAAMGEAFQIAEQEMEAESIRITQLRDQLLAAICAMGDVYVNGDIKQRVANNLNISFGGVKGEELVGQLPDLAVSTSSACVSAGTAASYVLKAIGVSDALALSAIRFSLGRFTTEAEIDYAIKHIRQALKKLRD